MLVEIVFSGNLYCIFFNRGNLEVKLEGYKLYPK